MSAVLLLSGGIDSTALAFRDRPDLCLTVDYGQRASGGELRASRAICAALDLRHRALTVPLNELGAGVMAGASSSAASSWEEFWPFRNQLLITLAAGLAVLEGYSEVWVGTVATDTRFCDGSAAFIAALDRTLALQEGAVHLRAPAQLSTTEELVRDCGIGMDVLGYTHSCQAGPFACGRCSGCIRHSRLMQSLGVDR